MKFYLFIISIILFSSCLNNRDKKIDLYFDPSNSKRDTCTVRVFVDKNNILDTVVKNTRTNTSLFLKTVSVNSGSHEWQIKIEHLDTTFIKSIREDGSLFIWYQDKELFNKAYVKLEKSYANQDTRKRLTDSLKNELNKGKFDQIEYHFIIN